MIGTIRDFIVGVIKECDPDLKAHNNYFVSSDIPDDKLDCTYHVQLGNLTTDNVVDVNISSSLIITIELFFNGKNEQIERLDRGYDTAIDIQAALIDKTREDQTEFTKTLESSGILIEPVETNDKMMKVSIQLNGTLSYKA